MTPSAPERSLVRWALHVGLGAALLPLFGLGFLAVVRAFAPVLLVHLLRFATPRPVRLPA